MKQNICVTSDKLGPVISQVENELTRATARLSFANQVHQVMS